MTHRPTRGPALLLALLCAALPARITAAAEAAATNNNAAAATTDTWPQFRGPTGQGRADPAADPPLTWSETAHVTWKTEIPGRGWSSPVISGNQVWMTTATDDGHSLRAVCVARDTGKILHDVEVFHVEALPRVNPFNSHASPSPILEPGRLYVCFGSEGSACLDTATAKPIWTNPDLKVTHFEGAGSTPVIYKDLYILPCDGTDEQYVAALDKRTGKLAWKHDRQTPFPFTAWGPFRKAFATPLVITVDGKDQLITPATRRTYAYDPATGAELWHVELPPPAYNTAPRPVFADGIAYVCTGYAKAQLWAIRVDATTAGDVTSTHVLWKLTQGAPLKPSPLVVGAELYVLSDDGIARCLDARTGAELWRQRVGQAFSASPSEAHGRIYFFGEGGRALVIQAGRTYQQLADNFLENGCMASPAFVGKTIYLRGKTHLYRIEN